MSILDKIKKNSNIKDSAILAKSKFFEEKDMISTPVPAINVALSGDLNGGLTPGLTMWAGPSKHFKTAFSLLMAKSYMDKYEDAALLFYDSEFGTPQSYFSAFGIDVSRVLHSPITDIEVLKHDIVNQISNIERGDHLIIIIDSVGNLASKKEVDDAMDGKSVADMTRAKQLKSLFRMITPYLTLKDIPLVVVNHTYKEIGMFPKDIVGGGCVVAGTKIKMADGTLKNVEDILVDEEVKTVDIIHDSIKINTTNKVTSIWNPETLDEGEPECFEIEFDDGFKVLCSNKHKFYVRTGSKLGSWIEAQDLVEDMEVLTDL